MPVIKLTIEYDGRAYHGWQRQPRLPTIQGILEATLAAVADHPVRVTGAGRTDAGVHALGQVASFQTRSRLPAHVWRRALNQRLPPDIAVVNAGLAPAGFDARRSAIGKIYEYRMWCSPTRSALMAGRAWYWPHPLSLPAMRRAARRIIGRHDFSGFQNTDPGRTPSAEAVCTIGRCRISSHPPLVVIRIEANRFLYKMARTIAGTLVEIGRGRWPPQRITEILRARDRRLAGPPAPACGLYLMAVYYGKKRT